MIEVYDIETYPDIFTYAGIDYNTRKVSVFELSQRRNDIDALVHHLDQLQVQVGFNNLAFDYPVLHFMLQNYYIYRSDVDYFLHAIMGRVNAVINQRWSDVKPWEVKIKQVDLFKVHHFDNPAKSTSLKMLQANMWSESVEDLPFEPGKPIGTENFDKLIKYNIHDIDETLKFFEKSHEQLKFRHEISKRIGKDATNMSDVKIGNQIFITELEKNRPGTCFNPDRSKRQTPRDSINLGEVLLPYVESLSNPEFVKIREFFRSSVITETKGAFKGVVANIEGFEVVFGLGGIHASILPSCHFEDNENLIIDLDVKSYYPNMSIQNGLHPEHLGLFFCEIYLKLYEERQLHPKSTSPILNKALKDALNGSFGATLDKHSPLYDPKCGMAITINGQLALCLLVERLLEIEGLQMLQMNTDGMTAKVPRRSISTLEDVVKWWESTTKLEMERADYKSMFIRDVNNYIAVGTDDKVKRKGAYCYGKDLGWHQKHSQQVVAKAVEAYLVYANDIEEYIRGAWEDGEYNDFVIITKVPRNSKLFWGEEQIQNITRFVITNDGRELTKLMPPLKDKVDWRRMSIKKGFTVTPCNDYRKHHPSQCDVNFQYYIDEAYKLVEVMK